MPKQVDHAWAAGIIDGEGFIGMTIQNVGVNRRTTVGYQVRISVRMTHEATIERLHRTFGGTVKTSASRNLERHKSAHEWYAGDLLTISVLKATLPYMTTKREQAVLILEYRERCCAGQRSIECSPEMVALRTEYYERIKALNRKGPK